MLSLWCGLPGCFVKEDFSRRSLSAESIFQPLDIGDRNVPIARSQMYLHRHFKVRYFLRFHCGRMISDDGFDVVVTVGV